MRRIARYILSTLTVAAVTTGRACTENPPPTSSVAAAMGDAGPAIRRRDASTAPAAPPYDPSVQSTMRADAARALREIVGKIVAEDRRLRDASLTAGERQAARTRLSVQIDLLKYWAPLIERELAVGQDE